METVINDPEEFRVRRRVRRRTEWVRLRKSVAYLFRYHEVAQQSNARYLDTLAQVDDPAPGLGSWSPSLIWPSVWPLLRSRSRRR